MAKINWEDFLKDSPKYGLMSAQEPPDVYEPGPMKPPAPIPWEPLAGCSCPDCKPEDYDNPSSAEAEQYPTTKAPESMSQDAYNLARISRGEEGKTAYFYFPDMKKAPKTIVWLWSDGFVSVHEKKPGQPKLLETTKEWWDSHVKNAPWPSNELVEDLYNDIFVNRYTNTFRYQIIENEKKYHKITSKNLLDDPIFVAAMVERMHDAAKLTDFIDEYTNKPKPKKAPAKTGNKPKKNIEPDNKLLSELEDIELEEDDDNPFEDKPSKFNGKITVTKLDETGKPVGTPVQVNGVTVGHTVEGGMPLWAQGLPVNVSGNGNFTVMDSTSPYIQQQNYYGYMTNGPNTWKVTF